MGGRGSRSSGGGTGGAGGVIGIANQWGTAGAPVQPRVTPTQQQASASNNANFPDTDDSDFHTLHGGRNYYQSQTMNIDTKMAVQDYLNDRAMTGSMYSPSQVMNGKLRTGQKLSVAEQANYDSLNEGMHNLGENLNLTRYDRAGFAQRLGINVATATQADLNAVVGTTFDDPAFVSTSFNNFRNAPAGNSFTDKVCRQNIKAPAATQALMPGIGPGGDFGEIILAPNQHYRVTGARFTGQTGRSGGNYYRQIEFDIEVF